MIMPIVISGHVQQAAQLVQLRCITDDREQANLLMYQHCELRQPYRWEIGGTHAQKMQRNRHRFMGDFGFSNEYKLQMVEWCFPSCDGGLNCNTKINVNLGVNINVGAAAFVALALVFVVCVAACVWPAKQFGAEFRMPKLC